MALNRWVTIEAPAPTAPSTSSGPGVTERHDDAGVDERADDLERARELGRQGDQGDAAPRHPFAGEVEVGWAQQIGRVGTGGLGRQERPLEMEPEGNRADPTVGWTRRQRGLRTRHDVGR